MTNNHNMLFITFECAIHRLIRLTSPNLNYLMIVGTSLMYGSGIAFVIPAATPPVALSFCFVSVNNHCSQYVIDIVL